MWLTADSKCNQPTRYSSNKNSTVDDVSSNVFTHLLLNLFLVWVKTWSMCKKVKFPKLCELKKLEEKEDEGKKNRREQKKICFMLVKSHKSSMQEKTLLQEKKNKRCHKEIKANNIYVWAFFKKEEERVQYAGTFGQWNITRLCNVI